MLEANGTARAMLGYSHRELLALTILDLGLEAARPGTDSPAGPEARQGSLTFSECVARHRDGSLLAVELRSGPLPGGRR